MSKEVRKTIKTVGPDNVHQSSEASGVHTSHMIGYIRGTEDRGESKHRGSKPDRARLARMKKEKRKKTRT